jgi:hypothetical protein
MEQNIFYLLIPLKIFHLPDYNAIEQQIHFTFLKGRKNNEEKNKSNIFSRAVVFIRFSNYPKSVLDITS